MSDARFLDIQMPDHISQGAVAGLMFNTTIINPGEASEFANRNWAKGIFKADIGHVAAKQSTFDAARAFFYVVGGRFFVFRFKDNSDYKLGAAASPQAIGVGDASNVTFQLYKRYSVSSINYDRPLRCIVAGSYGLTVDGVTLVEGAGAGKFTLDRLKGEATLGTAAAAGKIVAAYCQFHVAVRFDTDWGNFSIDQGDGGGTIEGVHSWPQIPLLEYRRSFWA